ncbi:MULTISPECIES: energy transducer TonB [unclassified Novosphingobium]|uniref:energy transducer TonB n=1 Tax=unclassified Novosphingobium TaxID=2644732 RepID=UPI00086B3344|nr:MULTISPECIES: TonB family protein [unclassified Novosphingobium]MBN9144089.1 energy transducer TonB [Novosphingobium sp.]MDR6708580.1 protein TonB [Novosphingobium sp. 1748]NKJ01350.1 protein TonB [Novosphingobium sp. SG707]ODU78694.1 MAG: energy transducer TonB [Novosphingobium sp. SCN 63-17]OJX95081.1 MAG: energy transducer TonB [Novosphingobium sp. 63-713]
MIKTIAKISFAMTGAVLLSTSAFAQSSDWSRSVTNMFASKQTYPSTAQMRGEEGTAKVKVYIGADGAVQKAELVAGSGSAILDKEALSVPAKVGKVPAPPAGPTTLTVPMTWRLT